MLRLITDIEIDLASCSTENDSFIYLCFCCHVGRGGRYGLFAWWVSIGKE